MKIDKPTAIGIMNALRAGTVPSHGLEYFAVYCMALRSMRTQMS